METVGIGEIIVMISDIQIKALRSISLNKDDNEMPLDILRHIKPLFSYDSNTGESLVKQRDKIIDYYSFVITSDYPEKTLKLISEDQVDICIHILYEMEDTWVSKFGQDVVFKTWELLFSIKNSFHKEWNYLDNFIEPCKIKYYKSSNEEE
jgi:hypothetical protein|nr:MAG TPA: hypothetical protein [Caudoviricetes sp.]